MRIISGSKRGKTLFTPKTDSIRPTSDRTREAIYNILYNKLDTPINNCDVLDIFCGTGALGLEAISRGAKSATFVDIDTTLAQKNAKLCGFENITFIKKDARTLSYTIKQYDLIFMDAPYNKNLTSPTIETLAQNNWCKKNAILVIETAKDENITINPNYYTLIEERIYGATKIHILTYVG